MVCEKNHRCFSCAAARLVVFMSAFLLVALPALAQVPSKLALSRANTPTADGFTVVWSDLSNETAYHLEHTTSANFTSSTLITNISANATSHALTGLAPGTTYYVRVRGAAAGGNGTWSDVQANQFLSIDPGQTRYLSVAGVPHGASHSVNFTISDIFGSANSAGLAADTTPSGATTIMLLGSDGSTAHTVFYNSSQNEWREGATNKGSEIVGFGKGFMVKNNTGTADVFLLSGSVPALDPSAVTVFPGGAPAGRLSLVAPARTLPTSLRFLGLTHSNNTTTGLKRATAAKDADLLLIPDSAGGLRRFHFDGTNWRSGLRTVADPASVSVPAGGAFFVRRASGSNFVQWNLPPEIVTEGLVFRVDAGNTASYPGSGTTWIDLAGNNNGTLTNGATYNATHGGSIVFDGVDDHVATTFTQNLGTEFSFGAWCRPTAVGQTNGSDVIVKNYSTNQPWATWGAEYTSDRRFRFYISNGSTFSPVGTQQYPLNQIYHVFGTYSNRTLTGYVNGVQAVTFNATNAPLYDNSKTVSLGAWLESPNQNRFIGNIYGAEIYDRALSPAEVLQNYNAGKFRYDIVRDGLLMHLDAGNTDSYPGNGTTWTDLSGNGNHGTFVGTTAYDSSTRSISFDSGANTYVQTNLNSLHSNLTISVWFNAQSQDTDSSSLLRPIVMLGDFTAQGPLEISINRSGSGADLENRMRFEIGSDAAEYRYYTSTRYDDGQWHNAVLVKNGTTMSVYIDNALLVRRINDNDNTYDSSIGLRIGGGTSHTARRFLGKVAIVSFYNRSLSEQEIHQNYSATKRRFEDLEDPAATAYLNAVEAADGQALETGVREAVDKFVKGCKADGIWSAIKASCILAGARTLNGALVPLVGSAPTNIGGNFSSGDYNRESGLKGNGSSKLLDSNRNNNADPQDSHHLAAWVSEVDTTVTGNPAVLGTGGASSGESVIGYSTADGGLYFFRSRSSLHVVGSLVAKQTGLHAISRTSSTNVNINLPGHTSSATLTSQTPRSSTIKVFGRETTPNWNGRIAFYSTGESLNLALLDSRLTTLLADLAAAIP
jgi:hypothetical protein